MFHPTSGTFARAFPGLPSQGPNTGPGPDSPAIHGEIQMGEEKQSLQESYTDQFERGKWYLRKSE